jgi:hypothetical protein
VLPTGYRFRIGRRREGGVDADRTDDDVELSKFLLVTGNSHSLATRRRARIGPAGENKP